MSPRVASTNFSASCSAALTRTRRCLFLVPIARVLRQSPSSKPAEATRRRSALHPCWKTLSPSRHLWPDPPLGQTCQASYRCSCFALRGLLLRIPHLHPIWCLLFLRSSYHSWAVNTAAELHPLSSFRGCRHNTTHPTSSLGLPSHNIISLGCPRRDAGLCLSSWLRFN